MKVCIVSLNIVPYFQDGRRGGFGGAEVQAAFIADALSRAGHDVSIAVSSLTPEVEAPHRLVNAFDASDGVPGLRFFHPRMTGIMGALARADADVYYQRNAGMITGLVGLFCRSKGRVFVYGAGSDTDFSLRQVRIDGVRDRFLYYMGLRLAHGIVAQNKRQESISTRRFGKPVTLIPNGVRMAAERDDAPRDGIVWIGALRRVKRPEIVIELAGRLPDQRFVMIGGAVESERAHAEDFRQRAQGIGNLELTGRLGAGAVSEVLSRSAVLINTSSVEGFPNAYLEAWSHGVPVVTFNDVDELVRTERVGIVCGGVDEMADSLRRLTTDGDLRAGMAARARRLVAERFSQEALAGRYADFFGQLQQARRRA